MAKNANPFNEQWAKLTLSLFAPIIKNILEQNGKSVVDADSILDMGDDYAKTLQDQLIKSLTIAPFLVSLGRINAGAKDNCEKGILKILKKTIRRHIASKIAMTGKAFIVSIAGLVGAIGTIIGASCLYTSALASNPIALGCIALFALAFALALTGIIKGGMVVRESTKWTTGLLNGNSKQMTDMRSKIFNTSRPALLRIFDLSKNIAGTDERIDKQYNDALGGLQKMGNEVSP